MADEEIPMSKLVAALLLRDEAAEQRVKELERERDEARKFCQEQGLIQAETNDQVAAIAADNARLRQALTRVQVHQSLIRLAPERRYVAKVIADALAASAPAQPGKDEA